MSLFLHAANAQYTRYIVRFKDKGTNPFSLSNPAQYLTQRALDRRMRYNIAIDSTDLPITPRYIDSLRNAGAVTILTTSKWLNQVGIKTSDATALAKINAMPFVLSTTAVAARTQQEIVPVNKQQLGNAEDEIPAAAATGTSAEGILADTYNYGVTHGQVHIHRGEFLHNHGFTGAGMQMVILDGGFSHYQNIALFDSVRNNNQILGTWDFVTNDASVNEDDGHGTQCFSTIAAYTPGVFVGTAVKTSFYLFRTEDVGSEYQIEEQNYAAGLERADSLGVDICSASLGYYQFDNPATSYTYADMNGNVSITARAADLAAKKGIMVVAAAGNEGTNPWHFIITPADGDSVMAVGAVDTLSNIAAFSSYGPSSDGQVKPNVAAVGLRAAVLNTNTGAPIFSNGTSFACPNMAGLTTCLMQAFPEYNNMIIMDAMQRSGTRASNPDNRIGYGIPDMMKAFVLLQRKSYTQQSSLSNCINNLQFKAKFDNSMNVVIERKLANEVAYAPFKTIAGTGSFSVKTINATDDLSGVPAGNVMYRVRMDIATDTSFYLDSLTIAAPQLCSVPENSVRIAPNPVISDLNVIVSRTAATEISILVTNAAGQRIYTKTYQQPVGSLVQTINLANAASGAYFVKVFAAGKKIATKQIIKK
jgi:serine protease AprX